jgi:putative FmdB family regulatory protein
MPMYTYQCDKCGIQFDRRQSFSAKPLTHCPECNGHVHRRLQPAGIVFKGSGWYSTDNRKKSAAEPKAEAQSD